MTYHRGFSHSILFAVLVTPLFAWLFSRWSWLGVNVKDKRLHLGVFLALVTHPLLDAVTIYGTQLLWPLPTEPIGIGSIFIIDPLYTLPLLGFLIGYLVIKSQKLLYAGLLVSTLYLGWTVIIQNQVHDMAETQIDSQKILVQPTPFNSILWRILVMENQGYKVGYYSLFDNSKTIVFKEFAADPKLLPENWAVNRLKWFTKGFFGVRQEGDNIIMSDLRMGLEPNDYVFQFIVDVEPNQRYEQPRSMSRMKFIIKRAFRDASWNKPVQGD